VTGGPGDT